MTLRAPPAVVCDPVAAWPALKVENLALLEQDLAEQRCLSRSLPPVVSLHTTEICNLRCVMCERSAVPGTRKLPAGAAARRRRSLPDGLQGLRRGLERRAAARRLRRRARRALRHGVKLDLVTNGTHLTVARYREMRAALVRVNVSLDAHVPEVYERIRAGSSFARVHANLRALADERRREPDGVVFDVSAILLRSNAALLPDFVRFAGELGVDHVHVQLLRHFSRPLPEEELAPQAALRVRMDRAGGRAPIHTGSGLLPSAVAEPLAAIAAAGRAAGVNVTFGDFQLPGVEVRPVPTKLDGLRVPGGICWSVALNFGVQHNGDVYPCCHPTDYVQRRRVPAARGMEQPGRAEAARGALRPAPHSLLHRLHAGSIPRPRALPRVRVGAGSGASPAPARQGRARRLGLLFREGKPVTVMPSLSATSPTARIDAAGNLQGRLVDLQLRLRLG